VMFDGGIFCRLLRSFWRDFQPQLFTGVGLGSLAVGLPAVSGLVVVQFVGRFDLFVGTVGLVVVPDLGVLGVLGVLAVVGSVGRPFLILMICELLLNCTKGKENRFNDSLLLFST